MARLSYLKARLALPSNLGGMMKSRAYGAAAAAQLQCDDDYDYYFDDRRNPMVDGEGSEPRRGVQWVVIGEPGVNRHLYAAGLSKLLQVPHLSMATLLRQELNPHSSLYKQIENTVNQGKRVPENIVFGLLAKKLEEGYYSGKTGFILDGIPRTQLQAEILDQMVDIDLVLSFKHMDKHLEKRELADELYFQSQGSHIKSFPKEVTCNEKLHTYAQRSKLLEDYYRQQNKLLDFQVAGAPRETWQGLLAVLQLQHMDSSFNMLPA